MVNVLLLSPTYTYLLLSECSLHHAGTMHAAASCMRVWHGLRAWVGCTLQRVMMHITNPDLVTLCLTCMYMHAAGTCRVWGIGLTAQQAARVPPSQWCGQNLLGLALTAVRDRIRQQERQILEIG